MASYGGFFESTQNIDERREQKREARRGVLAQVKAEYERDQKRKEQKRLRGEDTWMLPAVNERLEEMEKEHGKKHKKKKEKSKKSKKEKKKKKSKQVEKSDSASDSTSASEEEWVESNAVPASGSSQSSDSTRERSADAVNASVNAPLVRDDWMNFDFLTMKSYSRTDVKSEKQKAKELDKEIRDAIDKPGVHARELNPYWKNGGTGLPPQESEQSVTSGASQGPSAVGDGGLSWLRRARQRMQEQADKEQRSLDEVLEERYGCKEKFYSMLSEAERTAASQRFYYRGGQRWRKTAANNSSTPPAWKREERHRDRTDRDSHEEGEGKQDVDGTQEKDRGRSAGSDMDRDRQRDTQRDGQRGEQRDRQRDGRRDDERSRHQYQGSRRDWSRDGDQDRERRSHGSPDRHRGQRDRHKERDQEREGVRWSRRSPDVRTTINTSTCSLKSKFMKPSDDDDGDAFLGSGLALKEPRSVETPRSAFRRPRDDDDGGGGGNAKDVLSSSSTVPQRKEVAKNDQTKERSESPAEEDRQETKQRAHLRGIGERSEPSLKQAADDRPKDKSSATTDAAESAPVALVAEATPAAPLQVLSEGEMNQLGARLVKAELLGNQELADKLKAQLDEARKAKLNQTQQPGFAASQQMTKATGAARGRGAEDETDVLLYRTDRAGQSWPVSAPAHFAEPRGGRRKNRPVETHAAGERARYFGDDDQHSLQELVRRERMSTAEDQNAMFARLSKFAEKTDREYFTLDDMFVSKAAKGESTGREDERHKQRAMEEHRRLVGEMAKCNHCFDSADLPKHLVVAVGSKVYLRLPSQQSLAEGHCLIAPLQHFSSGNMLDEDIWAEIQSFRRALVKMFAEQDEDCVFMEANMHLKRRPHMVYECVPLARELGDMAPIYFKKAIQESDEEWAMNTKLVDLSQKDIRRAVPKGLPYFSVDFGMQGGFAHVIENEQKFPDYFGREILGGMMDLEPRRWRKPFREPFEEQRKKVLQFAQRWKPHDFTRS